MFVRVCVCVCVCATLQADEILTVHTSTGKVLSARPEQGNKINVMQLRPDDACALATAGADTIVRVYDESTGQRCVQLDHGDDVNTTGHSNAVYGLAWVPDQPQVRHTHTHTHTHTRARARA